MWEKNLKGGRKKNLGNDNQVTLGPAGKRVTKGKKSPTGIRGTGG